MASAGLAALSASRGARGSLQVVPTYRLLPFEQCEESVVCLGKVSCAPARTFLVVPNSPWQTCGRVGCVISLLASFLVLLPVLVIKSWHVDIKAKGIVITRVQSGDMSSARGAGASSASSAASPQAAQEVFATDTPNWNNNYGNSCQQYADNGWCANGAFTPPSRSSIGYEWTGSPGEGADSSCAPYLTQTITNCAMVYNYPAKNCVVCGKTAEAETYVEGTVGSSACPAGSSALTQQECEQAAGDYAKDWKGLSNQNIGETVAPNGCYMYTYYDSGLHGVWFNPYSPGGTCTDARQMICKASVVTVAAETSTSTLSGRGGPLEIADAIAVEASTTSVMIFKEDSTTAAAMTTTTATSSSQSPMTSAASTFHTSLPPTKPPPAQLPQTTAKPSFQMVLPTTAYPHAPQPVEWLTEGVAYVERAKSPTLFCWAIVLVDSAEKWLMIAQLHRGTGIFGCHKYTVFSDSEFFMGEGPWGWGAVNATPIPGEPAWKGPVPGSGQMAWHNTGVFVRAYERIQSDGFFNAYDWSVKVDPDTAFIPGVLQQKLASRGIDPSIPVYFVNCQAWHSLQGPLEVFSRQAGKLLYGQYQRCLDGLPWEDWGEDWFINKCLDMLGVQGWDGFDMLNDMWCQDTYQNTGHSYWDEVNQNGPTCDDGKPAHHPYKTTEDMIACLDQAEPLHRVRVKVPVPEDLQLIP